VSVQRFFKEPVTLYGVRTPEWRRTSRQFWNQVRHLPKSEVLKLCEELLAIRNGEERGVAFDWAGRMRRQLGPADFPRLECWLKQHVSNWGSCDSLCCGALGFFLLDHPEFLPKVRAWAGSKNRWLRRASAVAHIIPNRNGIAVDSAYRVADVLLEDEDDMVQKGYGWMLKELANKRPREVFKFVMARKDRMPRTALRYAIEKMPPAWKKRAMAK
jgi:3-methyladenine DNA glycosylase AlkD